MKIQQKLITHPLFILSVVLLLANDHVFKVLCPSLLTGKLSDYLGLFVLPVFICAIFPKAYGKERNVRLILAATGLFFESAGWSFSGANAGLVLRWI